MLGPTATKVGVPHAAGAGEPHWGPKGLDMQCYLCWIPPVGCNRAKWQCAATMGQGCTGVVLALAATMGGLCQTAGVGGP